MSEKPKVKILVCYHKKDKLYKNDILTPIHAGRALACKASKDGEMSQKDYQWLVDNMIGDDTGDNISDLNRELNEMTALYWAWKNYDKLGNPDYIGLYHYRRFLNIPKLAKCYFGDALSKLGYNADNMEKLFEKYDFIHTAGYAEDRVAITFDGWQIGVQLSESYHPLLYKEYQKFNQERIFYYANMFIMKREEFFAMCEEIFPVIFDFYNKDRKKLGAELLEWNSQVHTPEEFKLIKEKCESNGGWYPRSTGYMAEYLTSFYFSYLCSKTKSLKCTVVTPKIEPWYLSLLSFKVESSNSGKHKVLTILGVKIKIGKKRKRLPTDLKPL